MKVGYIRVSTTGQNTARQEVSLTDLGVERMFVDKLSGKDAERPQLKEMLTFIREGDVVVTESISRIARNTKDLLNIVEAITLKKVDFVSLKECIDTTTPQGKFMLTVFGAFSELERECILQRTLEGVALAKEQGKYKGKPKKAIDEELFKKECKKWRNGKQTARATMNALGMKPNTFYRRVAEFGV